MCMLFVMGMKGWYDSAAKVQTRIVRCQTHVNFLGAKLLHGKDL